MKKILTTLAAAVAVAVLAGCGLTGRNIDSNIVFKGPVHYYGGGLAKTNAFDDVTHPGNLQGLVVVNQHLWTDTAGNEEGTGRNTPNFPMDLNLNMNQNKGIPIPAACALHNVEGCEDGNCSVQQ